MIRVQQDHTSPVHSNATQALSIVVLIIHVSQRPILVLSHLMQMVERE
jgi:hypothetical protein